LSRTTTTPSSVRSLAFTTDHECDAKRSCQTIPHTDRKLRGGEPGPFTSLISRDCGTSYFAYGRRKKMSFAAVSRRPRMLTNYCGRSAMLTKGESESQCPATGAFDWMEFHSDENLISSQARVRESAIERFARIGYPALTSGTAGKAATVVEAVRIGPNGETCANVGGRMKE
ncbi:hypothetical protein DBV15_07153, partial [Temnothorax longispinosus]